MVRRYLPPGTPRTQGKEVIIILKPQIDADAVLSVAEGLTPIAHSVKIKRKNQNDILKFKMLFEPFTRAHTIVGL
jgi:hypothetical protein